MCSKYIASGDLSCVPFLYEYQDNRFVKMEAIKLCEISEGAIAAGREQPVSGSASWDPSCHNPAKAQRRVLNRDPFTWMDAHDCFVIPG